jgi:hypothetical protein
MDLIPGRIWLGRRGCTWNDVQNTEFSWPFVKGFGKEAGCWGLSL